MRLGLHVCYLAVTVWVAVDLGYELAASDWWRTFGFALALVCLLAIRRDFLTEPPQ